MAVESAFETMKHWKIRLRQVTDGTPVFAILIYSTLVAIQKVFCEFKIYFLFLTQTCFHVFQDSLRLKKVLCVANLTFKAFLTSPPTVRNTRNLRVLTESVKSFITLVTI